MSGVVRIILVSAIALLSTFSSGFAIQYGSLAPDFSLTDTQGETHTLGQYRGQVVLLDFYGWSCVSCEDQASDIETQIMSLYPQQPFQVLGIDQWNGGVAAAITFQQNAGITFPLLVTGWNVVHNYAVDLQFVVIDGNGIVRFISPYGVLPIAQIQDTVRAYISSVINSPPTALTISYSPSDVTLRWQNMPGVLSYKIYESPTASFEGETVVAETPNPMYTIFDPPAPVRFYRITAVR